MTRYTGLLSRLLKQTDGIDSHIAKLRGRFDALEFAERPVAVTSAPSPSAPRAEEPKKGYLRWLPWLLGLLLLLLLVLAPSFFRYRWYAALLPSKSPEQKVVARMMEAASYRAEGTDLIVDSKGRTESREAFSYVAPDQIRTNNKKTYLEGATQPAGECADLEIVLLGATRYQMCRDRGWPARGWQQDTINFRWEDLTLLRPWIRYTWCSNAIQLPDREVVRGVESVGFTCAVPPSRELGVIDDTNPGSLQGNDRSRFLNEAKIIITVWIRQTDGYIGKFSMVKETPGPTGTITQTVDYEYFDFTLVPPITAPR